MKLAWKAFKRNWLEVSSVIFVLVVAAILAIFKPVSADTLGYFTDVATVSLIVLAVILVVIGARRRVV